MEGIIVGSLVRDPMELTPYGFYRNSTHIFVNTAQSRYLENSIYNESCSPVGSPRREGEDFKFRETVTLNTMPGLSSCKQQVWVPLNVSDLTDTWCDLISVVRDPDSESIGLLGVNGDCMVRIGQSKPDNSNSSYLVRLTKGEFRFLKEVDRIGCVEIGEGTYGDCDGNKMLVDMRPTDKGYNYLDEVIVDGGSAVGIDDSSTRGSPFGEAFGSKLMDILVLVGIIVASIVVIIIVLICSWKFCCRKKDGEATASAYVASGY
jgi:hypothetical protein